VWALRAAAAGRGWHQTGAGALARYAELAREVNAACDTGRIPCGPPHDSVVPPLKVSDIAPAVAASLRAAASVVRMEAAGARVVPSRAPPGQLALFRRATHMRVAGPADAIRTHAGLEAVGDGYRLLVPLLSAAALGMIAWRGRRLPATSALLLAALGMLFAARVGLIGLIDVTSFPAVTPYHLAPAYPVWLAFCGLAIAACAGVASRRSSPAPAAEPG
jgi:hypothetical protein